MHVEFHTGEGNGKHCPIAQGVADSLGFKPMKGLTRQECILALGAALLTEMKSIHANLGNGYPAPSFLLMEDMLRQIVLYESVNAAFCDNGSAESDDEDR